jgi:transposase
MASFLGIDLSKETFHACLLGDHAEAEKAFPNTSKGFEQLTAWLKRRVSGVAFGFDDINADDLM